MARRRYLDIDSACGRHFKYRDLVECGNTWREHAVRGAPIDNVPQQPGTLAALQRLCHQVLDPLVDKFGAVELTYGFSSPRLSSVVPADVAPSIDQHAAHEIRQTGRYVCKRLGAAVDLMIKGRSSDQVARWIVENTDFDRLYYYGVDRPIHVSVGPEESRAIVVMTRTPSGRRIPRVVARDAFLSRTALSGGR